jgi:hypothetical protein
MKFKPTFRNYLKNHPGYIIGLVVVLGSAIWAHIEGVHGFYQFSYSLAAMMTVVIVGNFPLWVDRVLTQYDEDGNEISR